MNKIENVDYEFNKIVQMIKEIEPFIKNNYDFEQFVLSLTIESAYSTNEPFLRICFKNDISKKLSNSTNGLITLVHKIYDFENENEQINECILKFFSIQKDLKDLDLDLDFILSDNRKSE